MTRRGNAIGIWLVLSVIAVAFAASVRTPNGPVALFTGLLSDTDPGAVMTRQIRIPRALLAFLMGGALGVAGIALQALVRSPLVDTQFLGLSGGAGVGALLGFGANPAHAGFVVVPAFSGALAAAACTFFLARRPDRPADRRVLLFCGVMTAFLALAIMSTIIMLGGAVEYRTAFRWLFGGLSYATWESLALFGAVTMPAMIIVFVYARHLDVLWTGEFVARSLGVSGQVMLFLAAALIAAASVGVAGIIGFVGFVGPMIARWHAGASHSRLLPVAFLASGCFLAVCDGLARIVGPSYVDLPVGMITAVIGLPLAGLMVRRTLA